MAVRQTRVGQGHSPTTFEEGKWGGGIDEDVPGEAMDLGDTINDYPNFDELTSKLIHPTPDLATSFGINSEPDDGAYTTTFSADELAGSTKT